MEYSPLIHFLVLLVKMYAQLLELLFTIASFLISFGVLISLLISMKLSLEEILKLLLFEKFYHFFGWGLPCLSVVGVSIAGQYGGIYPSKVCYIKNSLAVFLGFFLPGLILVSINSVLFFFVASEIHTTLRHAPNDKESKHKAKEFRVLMSIFVTVGLSWIFGFLTAIVEKIEILYEIFLTLFSISAPLQGFFIFVAYCLNKKVKLKWMGLFSKCFPCCIVDENLGTKTGGGTASTRGGGYSSATTGSASRSMASRQY